MKKSIQKHWWNYRVVREEHMHSGDEIAVTFAIHEAYYSGLRKSKTAKATSISTKPSVPVGESIEELAEEMRLMLRALGRTVLRHEDF